MPVATPDEAKAALARVREAFPDATHHCWAWRLSDDRQQSSDDGEPGGSAGRPILAQIVGHEVVDALVVVTRYYGGTKLGVGGLVRAYGGAAGQALDRSATERFVPSVRLPLRYAYDDSTAVEGALREHDARVVASEYGAAVQCTIEVAVAARDALAASLVNATSGRVKLPASD